jgi:hypothetical protein
LVAPLPQREHPQYKKEVRVIPIVAEVDPAIPSVALSIGRVEHAGTHEQHLGRFVHSSEAGSSTLKGSDSFTMSDTQTEYTSSPVVVCDTYVFNESGSDTSSSSDADSDEDDAPDVVDDGTAASSGGGSGGYTFHATGTDVAASDGLIQQGSSSFTWGASDSESLTSSDSDVETDQDNASESDTDTSTIQSDTSTITLGAGGLVVGSASSVTLSNVDTSGTTDTDSEDDQGTESDAMDGEADTDSFSDGETDTVTVLSQQDDATVTENEASTVTLGAGYAVTGGSVTSSVEEESAPTTLTIYETDTDSDVDSSTESYSAGGESLSTSASSAESAADTSSLDQTDYSTTEDSSSETLGSAGVVLSGTDDDSDFIVSSFTEDDTSTGGGTDHEIDISSDDLGGNTTSDSVSTSETDTETGSGSSSGTSWPLFYADLSYGPGGLVTSGYTGSYDYNISDVTNESIDDTSSDSIQESETDSEIEAANVSSDTITTNETDLDSDNESDSDSSQQTYYEITTLGADMDVLGASYTSSESDTGSDHVTDAVTSTATTTESSSYSDTVGGETTTDQETDRSTGTDTITDTENDTPTSTEQVTESSGAAGILISGSEQDSVTDTGSSGETDDDVDVDTSTETLSDFGGVSASSTFNEYDLNTVSETETLTGSSSEPYHLTEVNSVFLGLAGEITGGDDESVDSAAGSGTWSTTDSGHETYTTTSSDQELDTGDQSCLTESIEGSGSFSSGNPTSDESTDNWSDYTSATDTLGDGGEVIGGALTESVSDSGGDTLSTTETDGESDSAYESSSAFGGADTTLDDGSGSDTLSTTEKSSSVLLQTLTETLGADAVVQSGAESESLSDSSAESSTETDHPVETVTETDYLDTITFTETDVASSTDTESDKDWATETLGTSATISSGSDCFTVSSLETATDTSNGSGPETYNDGSGSATLTGSGKSSSLMYQTLGDVLGSGGAISSGSLSYTDSTSESDAQTNTESGTETVSDELGGGPSQTASYSVSTTSSDTDTAYETGTETLGAGGDISGGTASFTWSQGNSVNRNLGISGIAAVLNVSESSTDTYGFGQSGTETITTGGADAPGTVSFTWVQAGTDNYQINQSNSTSLASYTINLTDTISSSWKDTGADSFTSSDVLAGETDTYTWNEFHSLTDSASDDSHTANSGSTTAADLSGDEVDTLSIIDAGSDSLSTDAASSDSFTLVGGADSYTVASLWIVGSTLTNTWYTTLATNTNDVITATPTDRGSQSVSVSAVGSDRESGTVTSSSYSDTVEQALATSDTWNGSYSTIWDGDAENVNLTGFSTVSYTLDAMETGSYGPAGVVQATMSYSDSSAYEFGDNATVSVPLDKVQGTRIETEAVNVEVTDTYTNTDGAYNFQGVYNSEVYESMTEWTSHSSYLTHATVSETGTNVDSATATTSGETYDRTSGGAAPTSGIGSTPSGGLRYGETPFHGGEGMYVLGPGPAPGGAYALLGVVDLQAPVAALGVYIEGGFTDLLYIVGAEYSTFTIDPEVFRGGLATTGQPATAAPETDSSTADGLPSQEASQLGGSLAGFGQNLGAPDGVSRAAAPDPTSNLVALAAAGRNPTDITIPTLTGSEGASSGGSGDVVTAGASSGSSSSSASPDAGGGGSASGSHEENEESWSSWLWNAPSRFRAWLFGSNTGFNTPGTVPDVAGNPQPDAIELIEQKMAPNAPPAGEGDLPGATSPGSNSAGRFGNVYNTLTRDFPIFVAGVAVEIGGLFFGPEDVGFLLALKAKGVIFQSVTKGGKTAWRALRGGAELTADELKALRAEYHAEAAAGAAGGAPQWDAGAGRWRDPATGKFVTAPTTSGSFNPANLVGKQAVVSPQLKAGTYPALVVDGKVYVARMHITAWELAGTQGVEQFYGFAEIDAAGNVVRLFK